MAKNACPKGEPCPEGYRSSQWCPVCIADRKNEVNKPAKIDVSSIPTNDELGKLLQQQQRYTAGTTTTASNMALTVQKIPRLRCDGTTFSVRNILWSLGGDKFTMPTKDKHAFNEIPVGIGKPYKSVAKVTSAKYDGRCPVCRVQTPTGSMIYGFDKPNNEPGLLWICPLCAARLEICAWIPNMIASDSNNPMRAFDAGYAIVWVSADLCNITNASLSKWGDPPDVSVAYKYQWNRNTNVWEAI